jgi:hypothetical protein
MNRFPAPPTAPAINLRSVLSPNRSSASRLETATGKPLPKKIEAEAYKKVLDFNAALHSTDDVPVEQIAELTVTTKQDLVLEATRIFQEHIHDMPDSVSVAHAALAGSGVTVAFLEVITKLAAQSKDKSYEDVPLITRRSAKALMEIAAHGPEIDKKLTIALGSYSAKEIRINSPEYLFSNLEFTPRLFVLKNETVSIDYLNRNGLRANGHGLDYTPRNDEVLLGCPYYSRIGLFYSAITKAAFNGGILEAIYQNAVE